MANKAAFREILMPLVSATGPDPAIDSLLHKSLTYRPGDEERMNYQIGPDGVWHLCDPEETGTTEPAPAYTSSIDLAMEVKRTLVGDAFIMLIEQDQLEDELRSCAILRYPTNTALSEIAFAATMPIAILTATMAVACDEPDHDRIRNHNTFRTENLRLPFGPEQSKRIQSNIQFSKRIHHTLREIGIINIDVTLPFAQNEVTTVHIDPGNATSLRAVGQAAKDALVADAFKVKNVWVDVNPRSIRIELIR